MKKSHEIKLLISDFDGTLVDTQQANFLAYQKACKACGVLLNEANYHACFGLRFEEFMTRLGITEPEKKESIKKLKAAYYPDYFSELRLNRSLLSFLSASRRCGQVVGIATTARKQNLNRVLEYFGISGEFDFLVSGEDILQPKPAPECYLTVMARYGIAAENTLIFEDSVVGIQAARASGANYIVIDHTFYGY